MGEGRVLLSYCLTCNAIAPFLLLLGLGFGEMDSKVAIIGLLFYAWLVTFIIPLLLLLVVISEPVEALALRWSTNKEVNTFRKSLWLNLGLGTLYLLLFIVCQPLFPWPEDLLGFLAN